MDISGNKVELIRKISQFHPAYEAGRKRGWSWYVGGMKDDGAWYFWKMYDNASMQELNDCLQELTAEDKIARTPEVLSEEDERKQKNMIVLPGGIISNELQQERMQKLMQNFENHLLWGKRA